MGKNLENFLKPIITNNSRVVILNIKILAIGDVANNAEMLRKHLKKSEIHIIHFPNKIYTQIFIGKDEEFFESENILKSVEKINSIKEKFDLCFVTSWAGARIAYLADLNYVIYFVGTDIEVPPFVKRSVNNLKIQTFNHNFIERKFYRDVLNSAIACIAASNLYDSLKKYRKDAIRIDRFFIDEAKFNLDIKPITEKKTKFTFFSPQRFAYYKGIDIIFKAIALCKSDFEILQVDWSYDPSEEGNEIMKKLLDDLPPQVKLIPPIRRDEIAKYYMFADAILGQMRSGVLGSVEREAAFCKKPVIHFYDLNNKYMIDGKTVIAPFLPNSNDPAEIAKIMDKVVTSKQFRDNLAENEHEFVKKLFDPIKTTQEWDNLFESLHLKYSTIKKNSLSYIIKLRKMFFVLGYITNLNRIKKKILNKVS